MRCVKYIGKERIDDAIVRDVEIEKRLRSANAS
jgi:hypothetical protein